MTGIPNVKTTVELAEYWRKRAVWAENRLAEIERELTGWARVRYGAENALWRLHARFPLAMRRLREHGEREQERRVVSRTAARQRRVRTRR